MVDRVQGVMMERQALQPEAVLAPVMVELTIGFVNEVYMNSTICDAIRNKRLLTFSYHGHQRTVEPHTYGIDTLGHPALRAYQSGGSSNSGGIPDWRLFHEKDMSNLSMLQTTFSSARSGYVRGDKAFSTIHCQL